MKKLLLIASIALFGTLSAQVNYGFEASQGFTPGPISGQAGWGITSGSPIAVVSTEQANPGTQSLKITGNNGAVHTSAGALSPTVPVTGNIVYLYFNAYFTPSAVPGDECDFFVSPQSPAESTINARLRFEFDGDIHVVDGLPLAYVDTGANFTRNNWNTYRIELDFLNLTASYYQNGALIYTGGIVGGTQVGNLAITNDNFDSSAYFDGIAISNALLSTAEVVGKNYKIYPNPTTDILNIDTDKKLKSVEVYDFSGRKIAVGVNGNKIDVKHLAPGVYILNLETDKGKFTDRFVKK